MEFPARSAAPAKASLDWQPRLGIGSYSGTSEKTYGLMRPRRNGETRRPIIIGLQRRRAVLLRGLAEMLRARHVRLARLVALVAGDAPDGSRSQKACKT